MTEPANPPPADGPTPSDSGPSPQQPTPPSQQYPQYPAGGQGQAPYGGPPAPMQPSEERLWSTLVHLGGLFCWLLPALIGYLLFRERGQFIRHHVTEALNFQVVWAIYALGLTVVGIATLAWGFLLFIPFGIAWLVLQIVAAVKANAGEFYRYPLTFKIIN